ncbi:hypothetical protein ZHAS_00021023 [Anopheles sinensis]|uniref:SERTA domain-containing protein n=1 Tax=Anopheles sinensis TaxID=74873 RepID=A0A084WRA9_ANOSI|nr:hypothetical protein ZHAS_00021023 [Anopheles sinensis]
MATAITSPNGDTLTSSGTGGGASSPVCGNKRKYEEISMDTPAATSPVDSEMIVDVVVYVKQSTDLEGTASQEPTGVASNDEVNDGIKACKSPRYDDEAIQQQQEEEEQRSGSSAMEEGEKPAAVEVKASEGHETVLSSSSNSTTTTSTTATVGSSTTPSVCSPFITAAPTILSPTAPILLTTPLPSEENAIAKLEAVAVPGEASWNCEPIVDSISKLQAVAVPGETWGGAMPGGPASGYVTPAYPKPGYFPEPYQNCARTGAANNGAQQYANRGYGWAQHGYYSPPYEPPTSQQTIRCAENGKSYFELAHHLKRCCDGRNMSCSNKQCYKERRLKMMNLSMFKLARFRQASDQSLYRSVLICNTLKSIEREIDNENKDLSSQSALDPLTGNDLFVTSPTGPEPVVSSVVVVDNCDEESLVDADGSSPSSTATLPNSQSGSQVVVEGVDGQSGGASTGTGVVSGSNPNGSGSDGATVGDATPMVVDGADLGVVESVANATGSNGSNASSSSSSGSSGNSTTTASSSNASNDVNGGDDVEMDSGVSQVAAASLRRSLEGDRGSSPSDADDVVDPSVPAAPSATAATGSDDHSISSSSTTTLTSLTTLTSSSSSSSSGVGSGRGEGSSHLTTLTSSSAVSPLLSSCASALQHYSTLQQQHHHLHAFQHHQLHQHHHHPVAAAAGSGGSLSGTGTGSNGLSGATGGSSSCWEFAYLDMDLGTTHELYDMFPSCYKITSFNSGDHVDMLGLKGPMLEGPSKVVCGDNEMDSFTTHIMVGS